MVETKHTKDEIMALLNSVEVAAIATAAGDRLRNRMMHFAVDDDFNVYLATMKGDPKTLQMTNYPSVSLLIHQAAPNINDSQEVEITGKARFVRDETERQKALAITAQRSPVVKYLTQTGNAEVLDCIKVAPDMVKFRIFKEIVQGMPPTIIEFPENRTVVSEWELIKLKLKNWWIETRVPFLTASIVPIILGTAVAWEKTGTLHWGYFLLTLLAGVLMQAGANVMNDYFDHKSGNDELNKEFVRPFSGGSRAIQLGLLTPLEVLTGGLFYYLLAGLLGLYLAWARGAPILALGVVGLISGMFYTGRPFYWVSRGVGELVIGLNFGLLMTLGAYYVQAQAFAWAPAVAAIPVALLIAAVLYINEFPDYNADKAVRKRTIVVRWGREKAVLGYAALVLGVYPVILVGVIAQILPAATLLVFLTLPLAVRALSYARRYHSQITELIPANALTLVTHLATSLYLTIAYIGVGLGTPGIIYASILGVFLGLYVAYQYREIERRARASLGVKGVAR